MPQMLTAEDLLAGAGATYTIEVPAAALRPDDSGVAGTVTLRPLTVRDIQRVMQAAREQKVLASVLREGERAERAPARWRRPRSGRESPPRQSLFRAGA